MAGVTEHPFHSLHPAQAAPAPATYVNYSGYTPGQIRKAYGFDQVSFTTVTKGATSTTVTTTTTGTTGAKTSVPGDGRGQTIAIVDAFNHPSIKNDLTAFDARFALPAPPSFKVVNQSGGNTLPRTDAGWGSEIALDVEWAHAVAPQANLLLVEANSDNLSDLLKAIDYARHAPGVSVVSMSWGGSEFQGETNYDWNFTTPKGHGGVTFINASGDWGNSGAQWPATSPNVVSVGGTSLYLQNSSGTYGRESGWVDSTGGPSQYEGRPAFQGKLPGSATSPPTRFGSHFGARPAPVRSTPDVSYDADPDTGFAVYDSLPYQGAKGWEVVGGTSAGAPQWAGLVAIANQGRALHGAGSLDGPSATLPALYGVYGSPKTSQYSNYQSVLHDVSGSGSYFDPAAAGYDQVTGLGTPHAVQIVLTLGAEPTLPASPGTPTPAPAPTGTPPKLAITWQDLQLAAWRPRLHRPHVRPFKLDADSPGPVVRPRAVPGPGTPGPDAPQPDPGPPVPAVPGRATPDAAGTAHPAPSDVPVPGQGAGQAGSGPLPGSGAGPSSAPRATASREADPTAVPLLPAAPSAAPSALVRVASGEGAKFSAQPIQPVAIYDASADGAAGAGVPAVAGLVGDGGSVSPGAGITGSVLSSFLGVLTDPSLWKRMSALLPSPTPGDAGAGGAGSPDIIEAHNAVLGLAPALWSRKLQEGLQDTRFWQVTAAVCLGVMVAGYWYTTAAAREAEAIQEQQEQTGQAGRKRRVREGWELAPVEAD